MHMRHIHALIFRLQSDLKLRGGSIGASVHTRSTVVPAAARLPHARNWITHHTRPARSVNTGHSVCHTAWTIAARTCAATFTLVEALVTPYLLCGLLRRLCFGYEVLRTVCTRTRHSVYSLAQPLARRDAAIMPRATTRGMIGLARSSRSWEPSTRGGSLTTSTRNS